MIFRLTRGLVVVGLVRTLIIDPEMSMYLLVAILGFIGAVVEWRRGGKNIEDVRDELREARIDIETLKQSKVVEDVRDELREARIDIETMKQNKVDIGDWGAIDARCQYVERVADRLLEEAVSNKVAPPDETPDEDDDEEEDDDAADEAVVGGDGDDGVAGDGGEGDGDGE
jgi:hypothetical protein